MNDNDKTLQRFDQAVISEIVYQNQQTANPDRPDMVQEMSLGDILTAIEVNLNRAREAWYVGSGDHPETMGFLRKVAALTCKATLRYGMPLRETGE